MKGSEKNMATTRRNSRKSTCIMLINDISKLYQDQIQTISAKERIKSTYQVLLHVIAQEDGLSQLEIANRVHLAPPTVSITLQKMEKEGLIAREPDPEDLRQVKVHITDEGRAMDDIVLQAGKVIEKSILKGISQEELDAIYPILVKMKENILED